MKTKILLVDDDEMIREVIMSILESKNYMIEEAENAAEVLYKLTFFTPELILLDINLHDSTDGLKLSHKLRHLEQTKNIPIIFITGDASKIEESFQNGGSDFISKPFSKSEIISRVENTLKIHRTEQALQTINEFLEDEVMIKNQQMASLMSSR